MNLVTLFAAVAIGQAFPPSCPPGGPCSEPGSAGWHWGQRPGEQPRWFWGTKDARGVVHEEPIAQPSHPTAVGSPGIGAGQITPSGAIDYGVHVPDVQAPETGADVTASSFEAEQEAFRIASRGRDWLGSLLNLDSAARQVVVIGVCLFVCLFGAFVALSKGKQ